MALDDGSDFGSAQRSGDLVEKKITISSMPPCGGEDPSSVANSFFSANIAEQVLMGDWNLFVSMAQHRDFNGFTAPSYSGACVQENERINASGGSSSGQIPSLCLNNGDIYQIMSSTSLSANGQIEGPLGATDVNSNGEHGSAKNPKGKKRRKMPEYGAFDPKSPFSGIQTAEAEQKKYVIHDSVRTPSEEAMKKESGEQSRRANTQKLASKQANESSSKGDAPKEDYIHLRAKRGHATNSHSLAERVRRQKISERMKFLQDLVPGCSKITGKAVMLDEIINYIQSLQRQVEFLSMKLATVNPELNLDIGKILSKDQVFHSQTGGSDVLAFCPGFISSHHLQRSVQDGAMQGMAINYNPNLREELKSTFSQFSPLPQISHAWQDDLQNVTQPSGTPSGHLDARTDRQVQQRHRS